MERVFLIIFVICLGACTSVFPNKRPIEQTFPSVTGQSLAGDDWRIPEDMAGQYAVLLIGYKQDSQFDIDRWLLGLEQSGVKAPIFELPVIKGFWPGLFAKQIDEGMRSGIPDEFWQIVITLYEESDAVVEFLGNQKPLNARALVLNEKGRVAYLHDRGYSVKALGELLRVLPREMKQKEACHCDEVID